MSSTSPSSSKVFYVDDIYSVRNHRELWKRDGLHAWPWLVIDVLMPPLCIILSYFIIIIMYLRVSSTVSPESYLNRLAQKRAFIGSFTRPIHLCTSMTFSNIGIIKDSENYQVVLTNGRENKYIWYQINNLFCDWLN